MQGLSTIMQENAEGLKDLMPEERKSMWRTADERRMSDLTRVMEWLERRRGRKVSLAQKQAQAQAQPQPQPPPPPPRKVCLSAPQKVNKTPWMPVKTLGKEAKKAKAIAKKAKEKARQVTFEQVPKLSRPEDAASYRRLFSAEQKGKRLSIVPGSYTKESLGKTVSELEMKDSLSTEPAPRLMSFHHQSMTDPMLQDTLFGARKSTLLREWMGKLPDTAYERRIKSLMEKGVEPKVEMVRALKPEEVLSCRYLRLSKNNIRTLLKLCTDAGMAVDIHPHMVESEIDAKKVFAPYPSVSL
ncbi:uncharacterized protein C16orf78 homolog [Pipistrellus kuhlii]|uniref:uncharacterized protein C16orf78 homolog n=1 Tax=Pipistrellus kuhlii TaxID=59472 RepID=UPI00174F77EB|nr:uncharacterized protein C16orf78 homolog [Pipistrellus kuhlii]